MHILQCYKTALPWSMGGVEQVMHHISMGLIENGHKSTVFAFSPIRDVQELTYQGYRIIAVPYSINIASMPLSMQGFSLFKKYCEDADIVHYHYPFPWMDLMHLIHPHNKPCVMTYHSDIVKQKHLLKIYKILQQYFLNRMDAIVATSPNYISSSNTLKKYSDKVLCIPLGLDESNYLPVKIEKLNEWRRQLPERFLLFVGVFRYYKGLKNLLKALEGLDYPVVLVGDGPEKNNLLLLKEKYRLKNLIFLGSLDDENKNTILYLSSGVILPSHLRSEAFGLSLLEGAMFGKPLLSCEIQTGTTYINLEHQTGWVANPNDPLSLKEILINWYENKEQSLEFGMEARKRYLELFKASDMVTKYLELYKFLHRKM